MSKAAAKLAAVGRLRSEEEEENGGARGRVVGRPLPPPPELELGREPLPLLPPLLPPSAPRKFCEEAGRADGGLLLLAKPPGRYGDAVVDGGAAAGGVGVSCGVNCAATAKSVSWMAPVEDEVDEESKVGAVPDEISAAAAAMPNERRNTLTDGAEIFSGGVGATTRAAARFLSPNFSANFSASLSLAPPTFSLSLPSRARGGGSPVVAVGAGTGDGGIEETVKGGDVIATAASAEFSPPTLRSATAAASCFSFSAATAAAVA